MTCQLTEDTGVDRHMALNYMGHVILTSHLLPLLKSTAASSPSSSPSAGHTVVRISIQGSNAHQATPPDTELASLAELNRDLGPNGLYGRSKLNNIL
jgi:NAD(P)-dependent dehydrogenase (short-subunit alcohol dehydrogenase family)